MIESENKEDFENFCIKYMMQNKNINSISIGEKITNGEKLDEISVVFSVKEKKALSELEPEEIIPTSININNQIFSSDVIEMPNGIELNSCIDWSINQKIYDGDPDPTLANASTEQNAHRARIRPLVGGISICVANDANTTTPNSLVTGFGTLGCLVIDNEDGSIVGLTASHVVCEEFLAVEDQLKQYNFAPSNDPVIQPAILETWDGTQQTGNTLYANRLQNQIGQVKRYAETNFFMDDALLNKNYVDGALIHINSGGNIINSLSSGVLGVNNNTYLPFATTYELDNLAFDTATTIMSGRTSGLQSGCFNLAFKSATASVNRKKRIPYNTNINEDSNVEYSGQKNVAIYSDVLGFKGSVSTIHPISGGDSGCVFIAEFEGGIKKIIGVGCWSGYITNANNNTTSYVSYCCRIDRIVEKLNISPWVGIIKHSNPNNWQYLTRPIEVPDPENPSLLPNKITVNNKTYWRVGVTGVPIP
jgi:hypothetical protein